jgi:hypothetical protein
VTSPYDHLVNQIGGANGGLRGTDSTWPLKRRPVEKLTLGHLLEKYPRLHPPVIDGLLREGETGNIVSYSKVGKSWLGYGLALSVIAGQTWLGRFPTCPGRVLLCDNELHAPNIGNRIRSVASAMEIPVEEIKEALEIWPLRGNLRDIFEIEEQLSEVPAGEFKLIILDAKYRMIPQGANENSNADETRFYNQLDRYAEMTRAAIINVHHTSKGSQAEKRVTDVGAGAGAQSRAADCHIVLRDHEEKNTVVLEAAVRSFAPVEPFALRWEFPVWLPDTQLDAAKIKGRLTPGEQRRNERDTEELAKIRKRLKKSPATMSEIRGECGMGKTKAERLVGVLIEREEVTFEEVEKYGNRAKQYSLATASPRCLGCLDNPSDNGVRGVGGVCLKTTDNPPPPYGCWISMASQTTPPAPMVVTGFELESLREESSSSCSASTSTSLRPIWTPTPRSENTASARRAARPRC